MIDTPTGREMMSDADRSQRVDPRDIAAVVTFCWSGAAVPVDGDV